MHVEPEGSAVDGVRTSEVTAFCGSAGVNVTAPGQPMVTPPAATLTGSEKLIVIVVFAARFVAPLAGTVVVTCGAASMVKLNT